jgi:hypothetical protein
MGVNVYLELTIYPWYEKNAKLCIHRQHCTYSFIRHNMTMHEFNHKEQQLSISINPKCVVWVCHHVWFERKMNLRLSQLFCHLIR